MMAHVVVSRQMTVEPVKLVPCNAGCTLERTLFVRQQRNFLYAMTNGVASFGVLKTLFDFDSSADFSITSQILSVLLAFSGAYGNMKHR